jgi:CheY-like chemotaxis protein/two-component sensor histidine kinase
LENATLYESEQRARASAEQASRDKDHSLAMLGHELRNPLSSLRNALTAVALDAPQAGRAQEIARHAAEQLTRLVDDLLDVTRVTQGRLLLRSEAVRLDEVVRRSIDALRPLFDERGVAVSLAQPSPPCVVEGDATRLEPVFGNLLTNAAKYTEAGGRVVVRIEADEAGAIVRVADSGIGIAPDLLPRIFDVFVQGEQTLDRSRGGLGIGLTLVKRLVELHGGSVEAHSAGPGQGAELVVRLPTGMPPAHPQPAAPPAVPPGARVLIVEDNPDAAESLMMLLELLGLRVEVAHEGHTALQKAQAFQPQLMLVDIGLPGMSGYDIAQQIRTDERLRGVRLVAVTGYGQDDDRQRALSAGFDLHLVKPIELDEVRALLAELPAAPPAGGAAAS